MRVAALLLLCIGLSPQGQPPAPQAANAASEEAVRRLLESLPLKSEWRNLLEHGARGDGIRRPWADKMRRDGIKFVVFNFEFDWMEAGRSLKNWRLVSARYFADYDRSLPVTDIRHLDAIRIDGLARGLEEAALTKAKVGHWFERPSEKTGTGYDFVCLADDEWLPVELLSPYYGHYEPGTTPLMHAALLGDVVRIRKLLSEGAGVNAVSPHGSTALVYAASSGDPAAVETLLNAGAKARTNAGGEALITAAGGGDAKSVALLLKAGADPNYRDKGGASALSVASWHHFVGIFRLLKEAGAHE